MIKFFLKLIPGLLILFIGFYFYSSSGSLSQSEYYTIKEYPIPQDVQMSDTFSVMTYNIGYLSGMTNNTAEPADQVFYDNNLKMATKVIKSIKPDIMGFQEIDFIAKRSFFQHQLDSIAFNAKYKRAYQSVNWDKRYVPFPYYPLSSHFGKILSGQAILTNHGLENEKTLVLEKPENNPFYYNAYYIDRLIQMVDCRINDSLTVKVMNVHLEAFDQETRVRQAGIVSEIFTEYADRMPVLLIGDFNSEPISEPEEVSASIRQIMSLKNIASAISMEEYYLNKSNFFTYDSRQPDKMIDYIFYNPGYIKKIDARVVSEMNESSDHLPVLMRFTFTDY